MYPTLETPIERASTMTPKAAVALKRLGIRTIYDVLWHLPTRYEDFSEWKKIGDLAIGETATVNGRVLAIQNSRTFRQRMSLTEARVADESGDIQVLWFNQPFLARNIKPGDTVVLSGKVQIGKRGMYISSPSYELIRGGVTSLEQTATDDTRNAGRLVPVYPETHGMTSRWIRYLVRKYLPLAGHIADPLPQKVRQNQNLIELARALYDVHFPKTKADAERALERLRFEEIFLIECAALQAKARFGELSAPKIPMDVELIKEFIGTIRFTLTDDQRKAAFQILRDMEIPHPMNRLLVGDVGSGKTIVAAIAALNAVKHGLQTALMAPTEILVEQHFKELSKLLKPFHVRIALLTGSISRATPKKLPTEGRAFVGIAISKPKLFKELAAGEIDLLIGTHALISHKPHAISYKQNALKPGGPLRFKNLGLAIIDEQHRFGVEQRGQLAKIMHELSGTAQKMLPHFLTMTATPIPRTLALTIFSDLDVSVISQMPQGRKKIATEIVDHGSRIRAYAFITRQVNEGRQAFIICPLVEESEKLEAKSATKEHERLQREVFPKLRLALLHGRMKPKEKEKVMHDFKTNKYDILVSTSVVEVGIDVPNATVMVIEGAERFGLAQLYQFRGRIGRSEHQSYCFLFADLPSNKTNSRLRALLQSESGKDLAQADLEIRGPGELTGLRQAGIPDVSMSALMDLPLIERAREEAKAILGGDPRLDSYPALKKRVSQTAEYLRFA